MRLTNIYKQFLFVLVMAGFVYFLVYVFCLSLFLLLFRKRLVVDRSLQVFYTALIRTRLGLGAMDKFAVKFSKVLHRAGYVSIFLGFAGMLFVSFDVLRGVFGLFSSDSVAAVSVVLPFEAEGVFYVPFAYWFLSVIVVLFVHEFGHGIFARLNNIRVKSTGFAVLGAIVPLVPGAFVDIDEKSMSKKSLFAQLSVLSAGPFLNFVFGALFLILMLLSSFLFSAVFAESGVKITSVVDGSPAQISGLAVGELIKGIDGAGVLNVQDFTSSFDGKISGSSMLVNDKSVLLSSKGGRVFLGVFVEQVYSVKSEFSEFSFFAGVLAWFKDLFFWVFAINVGVGMFNLLPLGFLDGGRMFKLVACRLLHHAHANRAVSLANLAFSIALIVSIFYPFF